jgi:hypothetical protein
MTWGEAARIIGILTADPSSALAASVAGWAHPISREALALYDIFDLEHMVNSKKRPMPHPGRPGGSPDEKKQRGNAAGRSSDEMKRILRKQFGQPAAPV